MSYIINKFNGDQLVVLEDGTIDTSTTLGLVGRDYVGYGETQNENFVFLLENFANDAPPSRPIPGQSWFDNVNNTLNVYNGTTWKRLAYTDEISSITNLVPYTGAVKDVDLGIYGISTAYEQFNTTATTTTGVGKLKEIEETDFLNLQKILSEIGLKYDIEVEIQNFHVIGKQEIE